MRLKYKIYFMSARKINYLNDTSMASKYASKFKNPDIAVLVKSNVTICLLILAVAARKLYKTDLLYEHCKSRILLYRKFEFFKITMHVTPRNL